MKMPAVSSILRMDAGTVLQIDQNLNLDSGRLQISTQSTFLPVSGKSIIGSVERF
jgi:hypothetical protein